MEKEWNPPELEGGLSGPYLSEHVPLSLHFAQDVLEKAGPFRNTWVSQWSLTLWNAFSYLDQTLLHAEQQLVTGSATLYARRPPQAILRHRRKTRREESWKK